MIDRKPSPKPELSRALESTSRAITDFDVHRRETTSLSAVGRGRTVVKGLSLSLMAAVGRGSGCRSNLKPRKQACTRVPVEMKYG